MAILRYIPHLHRSSAMDLPSQPQGFPFRPFIFDTDSAFGTVDLNTGLPYSGFSFCRAWLSLSEVILMAVSIRSRHRGLPMAIDRAVLLPGQELMERMDREYNGGAATVQMKQKEARVREDGDGGKVENQEKGQDSKHDVGNRRMRQRVTSSFGLLSCSTRSTFGKVGRVGRGHGYWNARAGKS